jgi:glyoxylase-like metal-dependent hydrolase (beta-lactamase superfamily II)
MINIQQFTFNVFQENTYIIYDSTKEAIIIDAGCMTTEEQNVLVNFIEKQQLKPVKLINTHCHIDHILGNEFVLNKFNIPLYLHKDELITYKETRRWTVMFNLPDLFIPEKVNFIDESSEITFGQSKLTCLFVPGHSIASIAFYNEKQNFLIGGDVIFFKSIGRTDLPGGDLTTLLQSIQTKVFTLPNETKIYSGHGEPTTVGFEKQNNPFTKNI